MMPSCRNPLSTRWNYDRRHTTASQAIMSHENLPLVGKLPGQRRRGTTASYAQDRRQAS